jgi:hypothetical protein
MRDRERQHSEEERRRHSPGAPHDEDGPDDDGIDELRAETASLLEAAGAAIGNALSGNSSEFVREVRQTGGQ